MTLIVRMAVKVLLAVEVHGDVLRMVMQMIKVLLSPIALRKISKHKASSTDNKNFDSWNKAKDRLSAYEYNKRRRSNACIN